MKEILDHIELKSVQKEVGSVLWLHGLGADGNDFVPVGKVLNLPLRFIFPHAPRRAVTLNNGYVMRAWYDIYSLEKHDYHIDQEGINLSVKQLENLIEQEIQRGIPADKIVLAGFSQGAVIALTTGLCYPKKLAGIIALSGYLPHADKILQDAKASNHTIPIFIGHGTQDDIVPYFLGKKICDTLKENNYPVSWHSYPMTHSVCTEEVNDIKKWLEKIFF